MYYPDYEDRGKTHPPRYSNQGRFLDSRLHRTR